MLGHDRCVSALETTSLQTMLYREYHTAHWQSKVQREVLHGLGISVHRERFCGQQVSTTFPALNTGSFF